MIKNRYVLAIISILMCLVLGITGCDYLRTDYEKGTFSARFEIPVILMGVKSQTKIFSIDDVTLDLYYAFYDNAVSDPDGSYGHYTISGFVFGLYICDKDFIFVPEQGEEIDDFKNIENQYFVKEITQEEFYNGYGYSYNKVSGKVTYDHKEKITIPKEFFDKESGTVLIKIYHYRISYEGKYKRYYMEAKELDYEKLDENTIKLK